MIESALNTVNTLMKQKSIFETVGQIEGLLKTGQISEKEFKKKKERVLSLIDKLPADYKKNNSKSIREIKKYLDNIESTVSKIDSRKAFLKEMYYEK
jgi:hypothetical protein